MRCGAIPAPLGESPRKPGPLATPPHLSHTPDSAATPL